MVSNDDLSSPQNFSMKYILAWGLLSFGSSIISGTYAALLPIFYQDYLGLDSKLILISSIVYAIWNALNDPIFGFLSDSSRSKKGRRIPFMRYTAPFLGLTFFLMWLVPVSFGDLGIFWYMLLLMLLYDTCFTIVVLAYYALVPELSHSDSGRGQLQIALSFGLLLGSMLGFLIPELVRPENTADLPQLYWGMGILAIICTVLMLITTFTVKERNSHRESKEEPLGLVDSIKYTFQSKSFLVVAAANFMSIFTQAIVTGGMFYLIDYVLPKDALNPIYFFFVGMLIGVGLANVIANKIGFTQTQQLFCIISGLGLILISITPLQLWIFAGMFIAGFGLSGPLVITNVLFAQVSDEDELKTNHRREGAFFGTNALLTKPAQSLALALPPFLLEFSHFVTREENGGIIFNNQPPEALLMIRFIIGLIPGIGMLLAAIILHFYPMRKRSYLESIQTQINAKKQG